MKSLIKNCLAIIFTGAICLGSGCILSCRKIHIPPPYSNKLENELQIYGQQTANRNGLRFTTTHNLISGVTAHYSLAFVCPQKTNLQKGQQLINKILLDFTSLLETNPLAIEYRKNLYRKTPKQFSEILDPKTISIVISCRDENFNPHLQPYLESILFYDGFVHYYQMTKSQQTPQLILKEPYEDAIKFNNELSK